MKMTGNSYHIYRSFPVAVLLGLLLLGFIGSCGRRPDPVLAEADSKMEEHPDSALMLLDGYDLTAGSSALDSAYYALLLTHARYKNFIDETNDSLISRAVGYFLDHGDDEKASRALFLQGIIQMNANRLGEAAVSFRKGLDIAHEGKYYMWEGQCARGLCMLYGELYSGSHQIEYAKHSYDSFLKTADKEWINYSKLNLARAFNNSCRYDESLSLIEELSNDAMVLNDSLMQLDLYHLRGLVSFNLGRYKEAVDYYKKAYELDSLILFPSDLQNIKISIHELPRDSLTPEISYFENNSQLKDESADAFLVLAEQGNYKDAYECLERYKNAQDSALYKVFSNNVSESIRQYEVMKETINKASIKNERMLYALVVLVIVIGGITIVWYLRERMLVEEALRLKLETDLESLRSDFLIQLESARTLCERLPKNKEAIDGFKKIIRRHYADANRLCDDYYQGRYNRDDKAEMNAEIEKIVKSFTEKPGLDEIVKFVDEKSEGLYSSFKETFFSLTDEEYRLFLYLMLGFNSHSISVFLNQKVSAVYNKKSRLKAKIMQGNALDSECYLRFF